MRQRLRPASVLFLVGTSVWVLTGPLARALPAPPLSSISSVSSPARWRAWLDSTDPVTAAATLLRVVAVVMSAWLVVAIVATALIGTAERATAASRCWYRTLHAAGRMLRAAVPRPLIAGTAVLLGAASAGCGRYGIGAPGAQTDGPGRTSDARTPATVTMTQTPPSVTPGTPVSTGPLERQALTWEVRRGDSMWSIAEAVVMAHGGTQAQVGPYWLTVVRANRRAHPDLIYPGDVLELPPYPA